MFKNFVFSALLATVALPAAAQEGASPLAAASQAVATPSAAPDTAAAIHRLFKARRLRRNGITAGLTANLLACSIVSASTTRAASGSSSYPSLDSAPGGSGAGSSPAPAASASQGDGWAIGAALSLPLVAVNYVVHRAYSRKKEELAVEAFQAHQLPAKLRQQLKPQYFQ